ncbi:proton channel OTOP3 [Xenopus laevis]|uniref:Proton channel OTOP3 n=1 Tax=Xenopus laevis TaxID=8355 RepID=A0A8J1LVV9_XENLA|nr:proton channel OTOP3 [Xenopus laevis]
MCISHLDEQATCRNQYMDLDAPGMNYESSWLHRHCMSPITLHRRAKKTSRLFSGLFGMNLMFMGGALATSVALSNYYVPEGDSQIFLCILMLFSSIWSLYHLLYVRRINYTARHKDYNAGAPWLKAFLAPFGICSILLSFFKIGHFVLLQNCTFPTPIIFNCMQILFIIVQTIMLSVSCKDCIQVQHNVTRYGIMLTLATDMLLWLTAVIDDSLEQDLAILQANTTQDQEENMSQCQCPVSSMCWTFKQGYVTLYPFNIEYSLICASMLFIMWKNVGRRERLHSKPYQAKFQLRGIIYGPVIGGVFLLVGICFFVQYQIEASSGSVSSISFLMYYCYKVIILPPMIICSVAGILAYSLREKEKRGQEKINKSDQDWLQMEDIGSQIQNNNYSSGHYQSSKGKKKTKRYSMEQFHCTKQDQAQRTGNELEQEEKLDRSQGNTKKTSKNYTRRLDVTLLFISAVGQLGISYFSIIATVVTNPWTMMSILNFSNSLLLILQYLSQTMFIIESMRGIQEEEKESPEQLEKSSRCTSVKEIGCVSLSSTEDTGHLSLGRRVVKETAMFLIISNFMCWIMGAFGAHPLFMNGLERQLYGSGVWLSILNVGLPLSVFYRMHSLGILLEVYLHA